MNKIQRRVLDEVYVQLGEMSNDIGGGSADYIVGRLKRHFETAILSDRWVDNACQCGACDQEFKNCSCDWRICSTCDRCKDHCNCDLLSNKCLLCNGSGKIPLAIWQMGAEITPASETEAAEIRSVLGEEAEKKCLNCNGAGYI